MKEKSRLVQCFPLISYLIAINRTKVDFISLDVEGAEPDILLNLPWNEINVTVWHIEHRDENNKFSPKSTTSSHKSTKKHNQAPNVDVVCYTKFIYIFLPFK